MSRYVKGRLTVEMEKFIRLEAEGLSTPEIALELFGKKTTDPDYHSLECKFSRWRKHPRYDEIWKDQVDRSCYRLMSKSKRRIERQIDSQEEWLANKAANDLMAFSKSRLYGDEENTVSIHIEGMPNLGTPDQDET